MNDTKIVRKTLLGPAMQLMNIPSVFKYLFNRVTVVDPIKILALTISTVIGYLSTTKSNLSYKE